MIIHISLEEKLLVCFFVISCAVAIFMDWNTQELLSTGGDKAPRPREMWVGGADEKVRE